MSVDHLIGQLMMRGIRLTVTNGLFLCRGPKGAMTPELRELVQAHRADIIIKVLRVAEHGPCRACGFERFWLSANDVVLCGWCHPPAHPELVIRWIEVR